MHESSSARLRITCADRPGIVAAVSNFLYSHGANITFLDQYSTDPEGGVFFMRLEFQTPHLDLTRPALESAFQNVVADRFAMEWSIRYSADTKRMAILVSGQEHCLLELLWRWSRAELDCDIRMVLSNHPVHREAVEAFGIPYHYIAEAADDRAAAEARMLELLEGQVDVVVLARYMRILSADFVSRFPESIINIHHSFLPAFPGADPYRQAKDRGVKLIGATAHYVTEELDAGPIIEQDVTRVSHRQSVEELRRLGRDIERQVLARAVRLHLEDRIIVHQNKTIVFR
ncbi:MAG: formyltetrahydrofolate deformylase [Desulfovibrio sp.]|nr:formyltetrahydrofolate deformylase [Desulfovibrio sp.]MCA1986521.1 formyltetrahydrofolate deformylase [Desulfovibrio sp.]